MNDFSSYGNLTYLEDSLETTFLHVSEDTKAELVRGGSNFQELAQLEHGLIPSEVPKEEAQEEVESLQRAIGALHRKKTLRKSVLDDALTFGLDKILEGDADPELQAHLLTSARFQQFVQALKVVEVHALDMHNGEPPEIGESCCPDLVAFVLPLPRRSFRLKNCTRNYTVP